jgi:hypothetical protein
MSEICACSKFAQLSIGIGDQYLVVKAVSETVDVDMQEASGQIIAQPPAQIAPPTEQPAREPEVHASPRQEAAVPIVEAAAKEPSPVKGPETP